VDVASGDDLLDGRRVSPDEPAIAVRTPPTWSTGAVDHPNRDNCPASPTGRRWWRPG